MVIYVDLWKDQSADPTELVSYAVGQALARAQGVVARAAKAVGLSKVSIHGVEFDLDVVGSAPGASLSDALSELQKTCGKPIVLIVDEAQHVLRDGGAISVMFALKSARDTINSRIPSGFRLILSGSDRDKLLRLAHGNDAPFLGSTLSEMPLLGEDFIKYVAGRLVSQSNKQYWEFNHDRLMEDFALFAHRPEPFLAAIGIILGPFSTVNDVGDFHEKLHEAARSHESEMHFRYTRTFQQLTSLQQAVLSKILSSSERDGLFSSEALASYSSHTKKKIAAGQARAAVEQLRAMEPPLVWRSNRGDYALEDTGMATWYKKLSDQGMWPPQIERRTKPHKL